MDADIYRSTPEDKGPKSTKIFGFIPVGDEDLAAIIHPLEKQATAFIFPALRNQLHGKNGEAFNGALGQYLVKHTPFKGNPLLLARAADILLLKAGPLYEVISRGWDTAGEYFSANRNFAKEIAPVFHADHKGENVLGVLGSKNEVIRVQRKKIYHDWMGKLYGNAASLPSTAYEWLMANMPSAHGVPTEHGAQAHAAPTASKSMTALSNVTDRFRNDPAMQQGGAFAAAQLGSFISRKAHKAELKREQSQTSYSMIKFLADSVGEEPGQDRVPTPNDHGRIPLKRYIKDVFQCHQRNMGEKELGQRALEKLDYACEKIADGIQNGQLNPLALVALVGERSIVRPGGKEIATRKEIDEAVNKQMARLPVHFAVDAEQYIEDSILTKEDVKHLLETLKGETRDFFMVCLPQEVVEQAGVPAKEYTEAKQRTHESFARFLHDAVMDLSTRTDKQLKDVGFKDEQLDLLREVAAEVKGKPVRSVLASVSTHGDFAKGIEFIVAGNVDYWRSLANNEFQVGDLFKKAKEEKKTASAASTEQEGKAADEEDPEERRARRTRLKRAAASSAHGRHNNEYEMDEESEEREAPSSSRPGRRGLAESSYLGRVGADRDYGRDYAN